jgi:hypothetical protein
LPPDASDAEFGLMMSGSRIKKAEDPLEGRAPNV